MTKRNITVVVFAVVILVVLFAYPLFTRVHINRKIDSAKADIRQVIMACFAYPSGKTMEWPENISQLNKWADGGLDLRLLREDDGKLIYIRPSSNSKANQPVIVYDYDKRVIVGYCDGHVMETIDRSILEVAKKMNEISPKPSTGHGMNDWVSYGYITPNRH